MRKLCVLILGCLVHAGIATAQSTPAIEVFGGYSLLHTGNFNLNGWNADAVANLNRWLGIDTDFDGHYSRQSTLNGQIRLDSNIYSFMFGPQVSYRSTRVTAFSHALFGIAHQVTTDTFALQTPATTSSSSANQFQLALGGGIDVGVTRVVALRVLEADYLLAKYPTRNINQFRYSTGIVFRFGQRPR
jgi:hypothetical protein